jgi:hypothetical protein
MAKRKARVGQSFGNYEIVDYHDETDMFTTVDKRDKHRRNYTYWPGEQVDEFDIF